MLASATAAELENFITRQGDQLLDGERPYRFISFNIPNLLVIEDAFEFTRPNPWRWPDEYEIEDALESVRQTGGQAVRTYVISVFREGSDMGQTVHVLAPGKFNEEAFQTLDRILAVANRKGIRLIIPLVDNWKWMGGVPQYAAFRGKEPAAFWSDPELIADFKKTIEHVVNRTNSITGIPYKKDRAILGWETGNEIDATPEWTSEIAIYIKSLDKNHLVIDGRSLHGVSQESLADPNVDAISTHHYPGRTNNFVPLIRAAYAQTKGRKPYFVGEFGFVQSQFLAPVIEAVVDDGMPGALLWSLRYHRREGGFYWHMEVGSGGDFYKAYHWPGFASGAAYEEREMLDLMRRKAFEIRDLEAPALHSPAAPTLLPIEHPAKISWQGSAGASSYDVLRATDPSGPWTVVGQDVSDADVQYRPLFSDDQAEVGPSYYYRVVARNAAGDSEPSNVVGPVTAKYLTLVDELADLSRTHAAEGDMRIAAERARQFQEDCHRLAMAPGSSVTYHVDGPIGAWRIYAFDASDDATLEVSSSPDGTHFRPLQMAKEVHGSGQGDYGYSLPVLYQGDVVGADDRWLRISVPSTAGSSTKSDSSLSAKTPRPPQPEISRVELDINDGTAD
jgi:hypothetical protein